MEGEHFSSSSGGSPMNVLVLLHKGFRRELDELRRLSYAAAYAVNEREVVVAELRRRMELFRSVYKYHCAAEIEIIFLALDARVKNIACTYYLQHDSVDSMFESVFFCLNGVMEDPRDSVQEFQELIFCIGTLRDSIRQHMVKEEKQVFPLFMSHFSDEELVSLVWQFLCGLPVMILEDLFPWLACVLSPDEQLDIKECIINILPPDNLTLQEVVISWFGKAAQEAQGSCDKYETLPGCPQEPVNLRDLSSLNRSSGSSCQWKDFQIDVESGQFNVFLLWHSAVRSDIKDILDKLIQIRSKKSSSLSSVTVQINFLTEVLIFYSNTLEKVIYPLLEAAASPSYKLLPHKKDAEEVQKILHDANEISLTNPRFLEVLCNKVESLVLVTSEHLSFQETEIFPLMSKKFDHETQHKLLGKSLRMLPLGLLKCIITWFSSHLPKNELKSILHGIEKSCFLDRPFASLLQEWARTGYSGKTTTENLQEMFDCRAPYMSKHNREAKDPCDNSKLIIAANFYVDSFRLPTSLNRLSETNLLMLSSRASNLAPPFSGSPTEASLNSPEPRPMYHIYYFHKAIKKDLESLVLDTAKLRNSFGFLKEFCQHFRLVRSLYELHSETEDKIAFPALEANPNFSNLTESYTIDHELESECFNRVSGLLDEMSDLYDTVSHSNVTLVSPALMKYHQLCLQLEDSCRSLKKILDDHIDREETELWPLFMEYFSIEEQEKILGFMLGRTNAEILQEMIVWLMAYLTWDEQQATMNFWRKATKCTKFDEWLREWWEGMSEHDIGERRESIISPQLAVDSMVIVSKDLSRGVPHDKRKNSSDQRNIIDEASNMTKKMEGPDMDNHWHKSFEYARVLTEKSEKHRKEQYLINVEDSHTQNLEVDQQTKHLVMSQLELEATIRRVSQDSSLDLQEKSRVMQNLMTSHLVAAQPLSDSESAITCQAGKLQGQSPSYRDIEGSVFGCKHYKQNCKLLATCCNRLFTCSHCHDDEVSDHEMERKSTTHMMCMKCLEVQPIGRECSTPSCDRYSMAKYYCRICKLFDDEREIYHCPYCNLCRVGKGLGIEYFHCMKCNACMSPSLAAVHICIEKCIEAKCPICQEDMFTSNNRIKSLVCGHVMHSACFEEYTCLSYTCPVCSKSLGNMQVYFGMLDALLAEEKMPDEYREQTQAILCNDCERKGTAPFHWLYHKCQFCGSYNTRLL